MDPNARSRRTLVGIAVAVGVLIVLAVALALQPPHEFDPGSPEGTAQGYFRAVLDGDQDRAADYLTGALRDGCSTAPVRHSSRDAARVVITRSEIDGADAELEVRITESHGDSPFDTGSYSFDGTLVMEKHGDRWLIAETPWPFHFSCLEIDS